MSIGATLAAARRRAGLTVSEVSRHTRVREPIIRGIEHNDFSACGGDFYARGHIRSRAAGHSDAQPDALPDHADTGFGHRSRQGAVFRQHGRCQSDRA